MVTLHDLEAEPKHRCSHTQISDHRVPPIDGNKRILGGSPSVWMTHSLLSGAAHCAFVAYKKCTVVRPDPPLDPSIDDG
jgi:hypothetical protein